MSKVVNASSWLAPLPQGEQQLLQHEGAHPHVEKFQVVPPGGKQQQPGPQGNPGPQEGPQLVAQLVVQVVAQLVLQPGVGGMTPGPQPPCHGKGPGPHGPDPHGLPQPGVFQGGVIKEFDISILLK